MIKVKIYLDSFTKFTCVSKFYSISNVIIVTVFCILSES